MIQKEATAGEITTEEAVSKVKAKFEAVAQELIKQDRKRVLKAMIAEIDLQKEKSQDVSFNRGVCKGLEIARDILLIEQKP